MGRPFMGRTAPLAVRRPTWPHPAIHSLEQPVELVGDPIEPVTRLPGPLVGRRILGGPHGPHAIGRNGEADSARSHSRPLPQACHDESPERFENDRYEVRCRTLVRK
jgi:hypothetical protein